MGGSAANEPLLSGKKMKVVLMFGETIAGVVVNVSKRFSVRYSRSYIIMKVQFVFVTTKPPSIRTNLLEYGHLSSNENN